MDPNSDESLTAYNHLERAYAAQGDIYYQRGIFREAIQAFQNVLEIQPNSMDACNHLKKAYTAQGNRCYQEGKLDEAIWFFQDAMKLSPDDKLHNNLGEVL